MPGEPGPFWQPAFERLEGSFLSSVWGSGPDDVFVVGGNYERGEVHHFDGQEWSVELVEDAPLFVWVHGFSSTSVYAVGLAGTAYHHDGDSWQSIGYPGDEDLWGIWGTSEDDDVVAIVGGSVADGEPVLTHYDGQEFTPTALDAEQNPLGAHALFKVWGAGNHVVAVGQLGLVLVHDGEGWTRASAGENADDDFIALSGTGAEDLVLVGGRNSARVATAAGDAFETVEPSGTARAVGRLRRRRRRLRGRTERHGRNVQSRHRRGDRGRLPARRRPRHVGRRRGDHLCSGRHPGRAVHGDRLRPQGNGVKR